MRLIKATMVKYVIYPIFFFLKLKGLLRSNRKRIVKTNWVAS